MISRVLLGLEGFWCLFCLRMDLRGNKFKDFQELSLIRARVFV
jgi:hypothetical protein